MKVLVTGAQGFIGRATVVQLLAAGHEVIGIGRSPRDDRHLTHRVTWAGRSVPAPSPEEHVAALASTGYTYASVDLLDTPSLLALLDLHRPRAVVHLAAALRDERPERLVATNIGTVASLVDAVVGSAIPTPRVVFGSSGSVYGVVPGRMPPLAEDDRCEPFDPYSVSKRAAEDLARVLCAEADIPALWARIFNPVGPGQDERHLCGWLGQQVAEMAGGIRPLKLLVGPLHTTRDYQHVDDTARALVLLVERGEPGCTYNVAAGAEVAGTQVLESLRRLARLDDDIDLDARPPRPVDLPRHFADVSRLRALGFVPEHDLDEGLAQVLDHYLGPVRSAATDPTRAAPGGPTGAITVTATERHSYVVETRPGLRHDLPRLLTDRFTGHPFCVVTDETVHELYGRDLVQGLRAAGASTDVVCIPAGEESKSPDVALDVIASMRAGGFDRRSILVNLGGGTVTDLGGWVAATYLRGVTYVNVPTTLLAQHDSAIGGKVAVNAPWAKNFIGAFHHPVAVLNDPEVLLTLPERDLAAGVAESIKVGLCGAPGLFEHLEATGPDRLYRDAGLLAGVVARSAAAKVELLAPDPYEVDLRRVLNLGHTFGHPLETHLGYRQIVHGEAVAFGIAVATAVALRARLLGPEDGERILRLLHAYELPPTIGIDDLHAAVKGIDDVRLVRAGALNYVVPTSVSSVTILPDLPTGDLHAAIDWLAEHPVTAAAVAR